MSEELCIICFSPFEQAMPKYTCADTQCEIYTCNECIEHLIRYSKANSLLPKCPNNSCNGIYILSTLRSLPPQLKLEYYDACLNYMMKSDNDNVQIIQKKLEQEKIIERIREERLAFIEKEYPQAILLTAKIVFKDKMKQLDKQKNNILKLKLKNTSKMCLNAMCKGFLDKDYVCFTCETEFCKLCEKKITANHECKQEDLDSINVVNNLVHCPNCNLPIFKSDGCDHMTCANCNTNFYYSTGQKGGSGNHGKNTRINVDLSQRKKIVDQVKDLIPDGECLDLISVIESLEPPFKSKDILLNPLKKYIQTGNKDPSRKHLARRLDTYTRYRYNFRDYNKYLIEIDELLKRKCPLNELKNRLNEIISLLKKIE